MHPSEFEEFGRVLTATWMQYDRPITAELIRMYFDDLKDYPLENIRIAIALHRKSVPDGKFTPKVADIMQRLLGSDDGRAKLAWSKVMDSVKSLGWYGSPKWEDPAISRAVANLGGWQHICDMEWEDEPFLAKRFEEIYKVHTGTQCLPVPMVGQIERSP